MVISFYLGLLWKIVMGKEKLNNLLIEGYIETNKEDWEINQEWEKITLEDLEDWN